MSTTETLIAPAGTWQLDSVHSSVGFEVAYLSGTFKGQFREFDGALVVDGDEATLEGSAKVASVDVKDENLSAHLQSPDFFDAEQHPTIRFTASDISLEGEDVRVNGELTIKGVTQPAVVTGRVAAPMTDPYGRERIGLQLTTTVDRTAFGVNWNAPLPTGEQALANDVSIVAELFFVKAA
ncbi:MAG TPA: YceI family protein [Gaiellaceae bacterium]|nr:YceI family protein [Gaiellaceae bacterium]